MTLKIICLIICYSIQKLKQMYYTFDPYRLLLIKQKLTMIKKGWFMTEVSRNNNIYTNIILGIFESMDFMIQVNNEYSPSNLNISF